MNEWIRKSANERTPKWTTKSDRFFHSFLVSQSFIASAFYRRLILFHYSVHLFDRLFACLLCRYSFVRLLIDCVCVCVCFGGVRFLLFFIIHSSVRLFTDFVIHSFIPPLPPSFICLYLIPFTRQLVWLLLQSFIHSFNCSFVVPVNKWWNNGQTPERFNEWMTGVRRERTNE